MTATADERRRGWCPGALRPMQSGDGLLVRIKPSCGVLMLDQVKAIAALASAHGNGLLELTSRGNLQLRGIRGDALDPITTALDDLSLLDASAEAEAVRNVISSPLAGIDATAFDTRPVVKTLELRLTLDASLTALSDKFGFLIDGGGSLPLDDTDADIRFVWRRDHFAIGLARESGCNWIGGCSPDDVPDVAIALARSFLTHASGARRMRFLDEPARLRLSQTITSPAPSSRRGPGPDNRRLQSPVGIIEAGGDVCAAGIGLPYGGTTSVALLTLAERARDAGAAEVRLTPWRAILIPIASYQAAGSLLRQAAALGFITDPNDPRRAIAACPGSPACVSGSTPVRADADLFARAASAILGAGDSLHISGCAKGCARRQPATITLVANAGRYGLVVNGSAAGAACGHLTAQEAAETLARMASAMTQAGDASPAGRAAAIAAVLKEIQAA